MVILDFVQLQAAIGMLINMVGTRRFKDHKRNSCDSRPILERLRLIFFLKKKKWKYNKQFNLTKGMRCLRQPRWDLPISLRRGLDACFGGKWNLLSSLSVSFLSWTHGPPYGPTLRCSTFYLMPFKSASRTVAPPRPLLSVCKKLILSNSQYFFI